MTTTLSPPALDAAARGALYGVGGLGFAQPTAPGWRDRMAALVGAGLSVTLPGDVATPLRGLGDGLPSDPATLALAHLRLFPPIASQDAPAHETAYRGDDLFRQVDLMADIAGFYRAHGLRPGGIERERPDHVVVELEFVSVLCRKEALAEQRRDREAAEVCRQSRRAFLRDHLACWAPSFARRVATLAAHPWYRLLGSFVAAWIDADCRSQGVAPAETADTPRPAPPPDDGSCGPCPAPGAR